ncbi:MAG: hypothetical protein N2510_04545 [Ignavibacteria bacterium]|nr:hypothetical protein [Ignavibacteria bacterium]
MSIILFGVVFFCIFRSLRNLKTTAIVTKIISEYFSSSEHTFGYHEWAGGNIS